MGGIGREMADQFTVQPESAAAKDRTPRGGGHDSHADKGVLMPRRGWIEPAWNQSVIGIQGGQREGPTVTDEWFDFGSARDGDRDKQGLRAALLRTALLCTALLRTELLRTALLPLLRNYCTADATPNAHSS